MEIISVTPRGYCLGVVRAIQIAGKTIREHADKKVYMLGMIVHNKHVVDACRDLGIICLEDSHKTRLELLDEIDEGIVIFTAHGVSDAVYQKARDKGLEIVDATCPDVMRTHDLVREHVKHGDVLYLGKHGHPEAEGTAGISNRIHVISNAEELVSLPPLENILITSQTTLSKLDTEALIQACLDHYPDATVQPEICNATTIRQMAVLNLKNVDLLIVVGDPHSNNSNQLKELGKKAGIKQSLLIDDIDHLDPSNLEGIERIAVTSGSSTPTSITNQVIDTLKHYAETKEWTISPKSSDPIL